jgi:hypothetical protein
MKRYAFFGLCVIAIFCNKSFAQIPCNGTNTPDSTRLIDNLSQYPMVSYRPSVYINNCNVTNTLKSRLVYRLFNWQWPERKVIELVNSKFQEAKLSFDIERKARLISKNDSSYRKNLALLTKKAKQMLQQRLDSMGYFKVDNNVILTIAWLNLKETVKFLREKAIKDSFHYDTETVKLALARFGDKKHLESLINAESRINIKEVALFQAFDKSFKRMAFLKTQESVFQLNRWIDENFVDEMNSKGTKGYLASSFLFDLNRLILNEEFKVITKRGYVDEYNCKNELITVRTWLINNKGKYLLNDKFCPY